MARPPHKLKKDKLVEAVGGLRIMHDVGAKVHKLKHLKLHGKMLLADEERAIVGSINLAPGSFDARRELAVETDAGHVVKRLVKITHEDWENSHPLDLSDEGLLADLKSTAPRARTSSRSAGITTRRSIRRTEAAGDRFAANPRRWLSCRKGMQTHTQSVCNLQYCCKARISGLAERLVQTLPAHSSIPGHLRHSACPGDSS